MKRYLIDALVIIGIIGIFTLNGQGAEPATTPNQGADPTATLLVEQGNKQLEAGQPEAAGVSFALASQLDPTISIPTIAAGPDSRLPGRGPGGFAEFGAASILGFIFIFGVAAYEIGTTSPYPARRAPQRKLVEYEQWPAAA